MVYGFDDGDGNTTVGQLPIFSEETECSEFKTGQIELDKAWTHRERKESNFSERVMLHQL